MSALRLVTSPPFQRFPFPYILYSPLWATSFFVVLNLFIYRFLAELGPRCCVRGLLFVAARGLLIAVASLVAEHGL